MTLNRGTLNPEKRIYRIVDFFEAITLLQTGLLRFSKISKFSDDNEGIDLLLKSLLVSQGPCKGAFGYSWKTTKEAILHHKRSQSQFYACCWTRDSDSIAMWTLYSPLKLGVRLETTVGKLTHALETHQAEEVERLRKTAIGSNWAGVKSISITQVRYVDLPRLHKRVDRFGKAYNRFIERRVRQGKEAPSFTEGGRNPYERIERLSKSFSPFSIKSAAYQYEQEVRGLFRTGSEVVTQALAELFEKNIHDGHLLDCVADGISTEEYMYVKVPGDFVTGVCIDPRAPGHWAVYISKTLKEYGVSLQSSNAFGYLPATHSFEIEG